MKYIAFAIAFLFGVPLMAWASAMSERTRGWLVAALIPTTLLIKQSSINFLSMETYRGPDRGFEMTLTDLIAMGLAVMMIWRYPKRIVWLPFNTICLAVLWIIACISMAGAQDPLVAAFSVFKWARAYGIFWVAVNVMRVPWPRRYLWGGLFFTACWLTTVAMKQKYVDHIYRIPATFDHSNTVPLFLNQFLPVLALWGLCDRGLKKGQVFATLIICLGLCVSSHSTFSRLGASLSVLSFLGSLAIANLRCPPELKARVRGIAVAAVILVVIGIILAIPAIKQRIATAPESSEEARIEFNMAAKKMASDHLFGVGVNNFSRALTREARYNQFISVMEDEEQAGVCHHIYNLTAAELGKPGLLAFAVVLLNFIWITFTGAIRAGRTLTAAVLWGILIGSLALHVSGFAEWVFRITPVTYMYALMAGFAVGLARPPKEESQESSAPAGEEEVTPA